jgi:pimeloyl-ACP methyl ester carboxylesterase
LEWLTIQNTHAYEEGFTAAWDGFRKALWLKRTPETEAPLFSFLQLDAIRSVYLHGHKNPEVISPDNWNMDFRFMERPNARRVQMDLFWDYRTNPQLYPKWQAFLRKQQPKTIIFWGQGDIFFTPAGGEAFLRDLPQAEMHRLESGHFAVEDHHEFIAEKMLAFYTRYMSKETRNQYRG